MAETGTVTANEKPQGSQLFAVGDRRPVSLEDLEMVLGKWEGGVKRMILDF